MSEEQVFLFSLSLLYAVQLLNSLSTDNKRRQVRIWLREGKKNFIERLLKDESEEARMEFQRLISSTCFKEYFPLDVQRKIAKMERDEQWYQLRDFVLAQENDIATLEYVKWEVCWKIFFVTE